MWYNTKVTTIRLVFSGDEGGQRQGTALTIQNNLDSAFANAKLTHA